MNTIDKKQCPHEFAFQWEEKDKRYMTKMCNLLGGDQHWGEKEGRERDRESRAGWEMHFKQIREGVPDSVMFEQRSEADRAGLVLKQKIVLEGGNSKREGLDMAMCLCSGNRTQGVSKVESNGKGLHRATAEPAHAGSPRPWRGLDFYTE